MEDNSVVEGQSLDDDITIDHLVSCERCGQDHDGVVFKKLDHPVRDLTHWATCPTNGQPILMRQVIVVKAGQS